MDWNNKEAAPTVADDRSAVVDNDTVISKVLPRDTQNGVARMRGQFDQATQVARERVAQHPLSAAAIAAALGGALVTGVMLLVGRQQAQQQGFSRIRRSASSAAGRLPWLSR